MADLYWPSTNGNTAVGSSYKANGAGRLYVRETDINPENNTSSVVITYQAKVSTTSSSFTRGGKISVDGDERTLSGTKSLTTKNTFKDIATWTWANIPHEADGSKTVTVTTSGGYGGGPSLYVGNASSRYANCVGAGTFTFELTKFDRDTGIPVYIGGEEYYCFIGNEDGTWSAADPVIG